ncbi:hypothetical protein KTD15_23685 [Burkholderia multivorans]|uniref:hypothetical protein n=1 Tax=Burkholderia multivorans TaxID=87883 RepID=UPI001C23A2A9|nr:hypothetical protein [Burkholderia multivorans]MBU9121796.1 hypothetical protein [Burkholderia multivorans]
MRFHIVIQNDQTDRFRRVEVDGERVDFRQYPTELFAVHVNPFYRAWGAPEYAVTHVGTGMRIAGGNTQHDAIATARQLIKQKSTQEFWSAIAAARQRIKASQILS